MFWVGSAFTFRWMVKWLLAYRLSDNKWWCECKLRSPVSLIWGYLGELLQWQHHIHYTGGLKQVALICVCHLELWQFVVRRQWGIPGRPGRPPGDRSIAENGKKRRSTGDDGSADAKLAYIAVEDEMDVARRTSKKKGFSWNQYFSEEIGISAPPRLFKNVRSNFRCSVFVVDISSLNKITHISVVLCCIMVFCLCFCVCIMSPYFCCI